MARPLTLPNMEPSPHPLVDEFKQKYERLAEQVQQGLVDRVSTIERLVAEIKNSFLSREAIDLKILELKNELKPELERAKGRLDGHDRKFWFAQGVWGAIVVGLELYHTFHK